MGESNNILQMVLGGLAGLLMGGAVVMFMALIITLHNMHFKDEDKDDDRQDK